ncbi:MAG TPA: hypothetical protein VD790_05250 [Thermoleophilaceae bacterium]|nr:hypothetical protein [Thermoleophilaceae bacterium]
MTNRIWRTFIAAVAATAVTASMGAGVSMSASASAKCEYSAWKITKRENVTCKKAKKVLKGEYGEGTKQQGWSCTNKGNLIPEGKCSKGQKSFKYAPKGG